MSRLRQLLSRLHLVDPFDLNDVDRAEAENAIRDHNAVMGRIESIGTSIMEAQGKLRDSIAYSRSSSASAQKQDVMARLVHDMKSSGPRH